MMFIDKEAEVEGEGREEEGGEESEREEDRLFIDDREEEAVNFTCLHCHLEEVVVSYAEFAYRHTENCYKVKRDHTCEICNSQISVNYNEWKEHMKTCKENKEKEKCLKCNLCEQWINKHKFKRHSRVCLEKKEEEIARDRPDLHINTYKTEIQCDICDTWLPDENELRTHVIKVHKLNENLIDKDKTVENVNVTEELKKIFDGPDKKVKCEECNKYFGPKAIYKHVKEIHKKVYKKPKEEKKKKKTEKKKTKKERKKGSGGARKKASGNKFLLTFQTSTKYVNYNIFQRQKPMFKAVYGGKESVYRVRGSERRWRRRYRLEKVRKRGRKRWVQGARCVISANERGALGDTYHSHVYVELKKIRVPKVPLVIVPYPQKVEWVKCDFQVKRVQRAVRRRHRFLGDIEAVRVPKKAMRYTTKEDMDAKVFGVDSELLHPDWIAWQIARRHENLNDAMYQVRRWQNSFCLKKFKRIHQEFHNRRIRTEALERAKDHTNPTVMQILDSTEKKGVYVYGSPGSGKTSSVLAWTDGRAYELRDGPNINRFAFHNFQGEPYIWLDDCRAEDVLRNQTMIKQLTDDRGYFVGERKGEDHFLVSAEKVIITSNDTPGKIKREVPGFDRRFVCVRARKGLFKERERAASDSEV